MLRENEKSVLVHWYYSISEWEDFNKTKSRVDWQNIARGSLLVMIPAFFIFYFALNASWIVSLIFSANTALLYNAIKYYILSTGSKWKGPGMPEIIITEDAVTSNGKTIIFQGDGNFLRKVDIKENDNINVLEILFECNKGKTVTYDHIRIPVPKGKLREAVVLLDNLNIRWGLVLPVPGHV